MLGAALFKHIELCTREVCRSFRNYEEVLSSIPQLERMDAEISSLRAELASLTPPSLQADNTNDEAVATPVPTPSAAKTQDYSSLLDPPDLPKTKRLLTARQNALRTVRGLLTKARQNN